MNGKVGCVFPMVVVSAILHAEFGWNDHRYSGRFGKANPTLDDKLRHEFYVAVDCGSSCWRSCAKTRFEIVISNISQNWCRSSTPKFVCKEVRFSHWTTETVYDHYVIFWPIVCYLELALKKLKKSNEEKCWIFSGIFDTKRISSHFFCLGIVNLSNQR